MRKSSQSPSSKFGGNETALAAYSAINFILFCSSDYFYFYYLFFAAASDSLLGAFFDFTGS